MASGTDVFLSYNYGQDESDRNNHERVSIISEELRKIGYKIWFDEEHIWGDTAEKIYQEIEQSRGVIFFITSRYHDKVNSMNARDCCQLEFNYAARMKTRFKMVPVVMDKCMVDKSRWTGLIGLHLGGEIYVNMSGDLKNRTYLNEQMKVLQNELQRKGIHPTPGIFCSFFIFQYSSEESSSIYSKNISLKNLRNCISTFFCLVIILFNMDLYTLAFPAQSFEKLVFRVFFSLCFLLFFYIFIDFQTFIKLLFE